MLSKMDEDEQVLLEVNDLRISFPVDAGELKAVDGVSFSVTKGRTLGLVGESGCGKSMTSKGIIGITPKTARMSGEVKLGDVDLVKLKRNGAKIRSIRGSKIAMIFQEPMTAFSPLYTIGNQVMESILLHRTKNKREAKQMTIEMLRLVGISNPEKRFHQYPHEFSGGMMQRAMIAMALSCGPELLIADEPTTALDVTVQAQVLELMKRLQQELGMAILFITHDLGVVAEMCDEVAVMYLGKIVEHSTVRELFHNPKHPYTRGLLRSILTIGSDRERLESIEGSVPVPVNLAPGCGFYERCKERIAGVCDKMNVPETKLSDSHRVSCFLYDDSVAETERNYG